MTNNERQFVVKKIKKYNSDIERHSKNEKMLACCLLPFAGSMAWLFPTEGEILRQLIAIIDVLGIGTTLFFLGQNEGAKSNSKQKVKDLTELLDNDNVSRNR